MALGEDVKEKNLARIDAMRGSELVGLVARPAPVDHNVFGVH